RRYARQLRITAIRRRDVEPTFDAVGRGSDQFLSQVLCRMIFHQIEREWATETAFVIAGGPSVLNYDLEMLRGRNVIVINSSIHTVPWANFLYFGDWRWWNEPENRAAVDSFAGQVITTSRMVRDPKVKICNRINPPGLAFERDSLTQKVTSLTAATN